jgi:hypothetical protein
MSKNHECVDNNSPVRRGSHHILLDFGIFGHLFLEHFHKMIDQRRVKFGRRQYFNAAVDPILQQQVMVRFETYRKVSDARSNRLDLHINILLHINGIRLEVKLRLSESGTSRLQSANLIDYQRRIALMCKVNDVQMRLNYPIFRCNQFGDVVRGKLHLVGTPILSVHTIGHRSPVRQMCVGEFGQTPGNWMGAPIVQMPIVDDCEGYDRLEGGKDSKTNPQRTGATVVGGHIIRIRSELDENYVELGQQRVYHQRQIDAFYVVLDKVDGFIDQIRGENLVDGESGAHEFGGWVNAGRGQQEVQQCEYKLSV